VMRAGWAGSVTFHSFAVLSTLAVARVRPFGLNATPTTRPLWPVKVAMRAGWGTEDGLGIPPLLGQEPQVERVRLGPMSVWTRAELVRNDRLTAARVATATAAARRPVTSRGLERGGGVRGVLPAAFMIPSWRCPTLSAWERRAGVGVSCGRTVGGGWVYRLPS